MKPLDERLKEVEKQMERNLQKAFNDEKLNDEYRKLLKEKQNEK